MTAKVKFSLARPGSNLEPPVAEVDVTEGKPSPLEVARCCIAQVIPATVSSAHRLSIVRCRCGLHYTRSRYAVALDIGERRVWGFLLTIES